MSQARSLSVLAASITLIASTNTFAQASTIKIDGSSTVFPVTEAVAEEFQKANRGLKVTVGVSGTGGGFRKFCRGETDVQNASRPILKGEMAECKNNGVQFVELPVAYDALTVVVNPRSPLNSITIEDLKKSGVFAVVTPDECVELVRQQGRVILHPLMGGLDPEFGWQGLRLFQEKVLPRIRQL